MAGKAYLERACIVPSADVPGAKSALKAGVMATRLGTGGKSGAKVAPGDDEAEEQGSAAARIMHQSHARKAETLAMEDVLGDAKLCLSLRAHAARMGIGEASVAFLSAHRELAAARAAVAPASVTSGARTRLATIGTEALLARYLREPHARRLPIECADAVTATTAAHAAASSDAEALLAAFTPVREALEVVLFPALLALRKEAARQSVMRSGEGSKGRARVVVCGGGYAGCAVAADLSSEPDKFSVVLIDPKEYFEDVTAQPRAMVSCSSDEYTGPGDTGSTWAKTVTMYKDFVVKNGELVCGQIAAVHPTHVEVGAARLAIPYDYLILATGSSYASGIKPNNTSLAFRHQQMRAERDALRDANQVLIVGGGLVGVEVTGEVAEAFPNKKITLVHSHDKLLPNVRGAHELAAPVLEKLGVTLVLGQRLMPSESSQAVGGGGGSFVTSSGTRIEADKVIWATGYTPNTEYLRGDSDRSLTRALDEAGFVKVDASMRVLGFDHIFACGDMVSASASRCRAFGSISDGSISRPERTAQAASAAGFVASENVRRLHAGRGELEIVRMDQRRVGDKANASISVGPSRGLMCFHPDVFAGCARHATPPP